MKILNVGLIGCGGFVRHTHLANLIAHPGLRVHATADVDENSARWAAEAGGASYWTLDAGRVVDDPAVDLVFIATPHHTHAELTIRAVNAGRHVYCEKPMGLSPAECESVAAAVRRAGVQYFAGYNRAVAPFTLTARERLAALGAPVLMHHRFADWNPYGTSWMIDEALSGGRIVGEAGHGLDLMCRLAGQDPVRVYAEGGNFAAPSATGCPDSALITLGFPDGSAGTLLLSSVASNGYPKEELVATCGGQTIVIHGFERMSIFSASGEEASVLPASDKGHRAMLEMAYRAISEGGPNPAGIGQALRASRMTFAAMRSIRDRSVQAPAAFAPGS